MSKTVTAYPAYWGNPDTGERCEYVYVADWQGLVLPKQLKGYTVYFQSSHYYDLDQEKVIDFNAVIEGLYQEAATLRWIAEEKLDWFKQDSNQKRHEMGSTRPSGHYTYPPPAFVLRASSLKGALKRIFNRKKR